MKIPPKPRKKKRRNKASDPGTEKTSPGGRAFQRIGQQHIARGLDAPQISGLVLEGETVASDSAFAKKRRKVKKPAATRKKTSRKSAKQSRRTQTKRITKKTK